MENILPCKVTSPRHPFLRLETGKSNGNAKVKCLLQFKEESNSIHHTAFGIFIISLLNQISFDGHSLRKTFLFPQVSRFFPPNSFVLHSHFTTWVCWLFRSKPQRRKTLMQNWKSFTCSYLRFVHLKHHQESEGKCSSHTSLKLYWALFTKTMLK